MANLERKRWMNIDDRQLNYTGTWFVDSYDQPRPFRAVGSLSGQSAHGTTTEGTVSFSFEGAAFNVPGRSNINPSTTNSTIRCTVDGADAPSDVVTASNLNFYDLCFGANLNEGLHQVSIHINPGPNTTFWVDSVNFNSLPYPNIRGKFSQQLADNSAFRYVGISWRNPYDETGGDGRETYETGAKAIIPFFGDSVELRGYLTQEMPRVAGSASYSIDGSPPTTFTLLIWTSGFRGTGVNASIWRHTMLRTPKLPPGYHTLELVNIGNSTTVPLTIDYFLVSHGDIDNPVKAPERSAQVTAASSQNPATTTTPIGSTTSSRIKIGPIVGGVVGGIALFACIGVFLYFCLLRRRRSKIQEPPARLTYEEATALNIRTRDLTTATAPYNTEPTPDTWDGGPATLSPQRFGTPAPPQMATKRTPEAPLRRLPPPLHPQQQQLRSGPARSVSPASQEQMQDSTSDIYTGSPPARPARTPPLRHGSPSDQRHYTTSPTSISPSMSVQVGSATVGQYDRSALPRGAPAKAGFSPRLYTTK